MSENKALRIEIDKKKQMRTKEISRMIDEGGIGAYSYYDFPKKAPYKKETRSQEISDMIDEGGLGSANYYGYETIKNYKK